MKRQYSGRAVALVAVGCLVAGLAGGGGVGYAVGRRGSPAVAAEPARPTYTRAEFDRLVTGKTEQEVIDLLGRPSETKGIGDEVLWWYYRVTRDPIADRIDERAVITFRDGRVTRVGH